MDTTTPQIKLDVLTRGETVVAQIKAQTFLGGDKFWSFKTTTESAGARYDFDGKYNWCPLGDVARVTDALKASGFKVVGSRVLVAALQRLKDALTAAEQGAMAMADDFDRRLTAVGMCLYPYQREGARILASATEGFALLDDMGLGKTIQVLASLPVNARVIVVGPKSAKTVWRLEAAKWRNDLRTTILEGRGSFRWPEPGEIVALNYAIMPKGDAIPAGCPEGVVVVFDEAQHIRNRKSQQSMASQALADAVRARGGKAFVLTATPLDNTPFELWTLFKIAGIDRRVFGGWDGFLNLFNGHKSGYGYEFGEPDTEALTERMRRASLRRSKDLVLPQLPQKTRQQIPVPIPAALASQCTVAARDLDALVDMIRQNPKPDFQKYSRLYEALSTAMIPTMLDIAEQCESSNTPLVVFSPHLEPIRALGKREGWAIITGETPTAEREEYVRQFQAGELLGLGGTIAAMGTAVTLTRGSTVLFVNRSFVPGENNQAEDRCRRLGQKNAVMILQLIADHALALRISEILNEKQALIDASVGAAEIGPKDTQVTALDHMASLPL